MVRKSSAVDEDDDEWLAEAWQAGPSTAFYNLECLMQCPVYQDEILVKDCISLTPLSHPDCSPLSQIKSILKQSIKEAAGAYDVCPRAQDVDDEAWMTMPGIDEMALLNSTTYTPAARDCDDKNNVLNAMLDGVHTFLRGASGVEGVTHDYSGDFSSIPLSINPTDFLNLLHATLKAESADDIVIPDRNYVETNDPFFSPDDYDLMEPDDGDGGPMRDHGSHGSRTRGSVVLITKLGRA
jgi:hypothetical protein